MFHFSFSFKYFLEKKLLMGWGINVPEWTAEKMVTLVYLCVCMLFSYSIRNKIELYIITSSGGFPIRLKVGKFLKGAYFLGIPNFDLRLL